MTDRDTVINTEPSLKAYFHDALSRATEKHHLETEDHTLWYLTNLLHTYSRSERFFDYLPDRGTLTPLAEYYQRAIEADSIQERRLNLQRLGDVAIFISGLFAPALNKKSVGINYYMAMGENAYGTLADTAGQNTRDKAQAEIFADLSNRFTSFVTVLSSLSKLRMTDKTSEVCDNLLNKVDEWQRTGDLAIASDLRNAGVILDLDSELVH